MNVLWVLVVGQETMVYSRKSGRRCVEGKGPERKVATDAEEPSKCLLGKQSTLHCRTCVKSGLFACEPVVERALRQLIVTSTAGRTTRTEPSVTQALMDWVVLSHDEK